MTSREKAIEKVTKLLNLANDAGATENERQNAYQAAQKIMLQHEIVEQDTVQSEFVKVVKELDKFGGNQWQRSLYHALGKVNGVFTFHAVGKKGMYLYGSKQDIHVLSCMYDFIASSIMREAQVRFKQQTAVTKGKFHKSFSIGAVRGYSQKIDELRSHPGYGIVLNREAKAKFAYLDESGARLTSNRPKPAIDWGVQSEGRAYGRTLNDKPLTTSLNSRMLTGGK